MPRYDIDDYARIPWVIGPLYHGSKLQKYHNKLRKEALLKEGAEAVALNPFPNSNFRETDTQTGIPCNCVRHRPCTCVPHKGACPNPELTYAPNSKIKSVVPNIITTKEQNPRKSLKKPQIQDSSSQMFAKPRGSAQHSSTNRRRQSTSKVCKYQSSDSATSTDSSESEDTSLARTKSNHKSKARPKSSTRQSARPTKHLKPPKNTLEYSYVTSNTDSTNDEIEDAIVTKRSSKSNTKFSRSVTNDLNPKLNPKLSRSASRTKYSHEDNDSSDDLLDDIVNALKCFKKDKASRKTPTMKVLTSKHSSKASTTNLIDSDSDSIGNNSGDDILAQKLAKLLKISTKDLLSKKFIAKACPKSSTRFHQPRHRTYRVDSSSNESEGEPITAKNPKMTTAIRGDSQTKDLLSKANSKSLRRSSVDRKYLSRSNCDSSTDQFDDLKPRSCHRKSSSRPSLEERSRTGLRKSFGGHKYLPSDSDSSTDQSDDGKLRRSNRKSNSCSSREERGRFSRNPKSSMKSSIIDVLAQLSGGEPKAKNTKSKLGQPKHGKKVRFADYNRYKCEDQHSEYPYDSEDSLPTSNDEGYISEEGIRSALLRTATNAPVAGRKGRRQKQSADDLQPIIENEFKLEAKRRLEERRARLREEKRAAAEKAAQDESARREDEKDAKLWLEERDAVRKGILEAPERNRFTKSERELVAKMRDEYAIYEWVASANRMCVARAEEFVDERDGARREEAAELEGEEERREADRKALRLVDQRTADRWLAAEESRCQRMCQQWLDKSTAARQQGVAIPPPAPYRFLANALPIAPKPRAGEAAALPHKRTTSGRLRPVREQHEEPNW